MKPQQFDQLVKGVAEMKLHMRGTSVAGVRTTVVNTADVPPSNRFEKPPKSAKASLPNSSA